MAAELEGKVECPLFRALPFSEPKVQKDGDYDIVEPQQETALVGQDGTVDIKIKGLRTGTARMIFGIPGTGVGVGVEAATDVKVNAVKQWRKFSGNTLGTSQDKLKDKFDALHPVYSDNEDGTAEENQQKTEAELARLQKIMDGTPDESSPKFTVFDWTKIENPEEVLFDKPDADPTLDLDVTKLKLLGVGVEAVPKVTATTSVDGGTKKAFVVEFEMTFTFDQSAFGVSLDSALVLHSSSQPVRIIASEGEVLSSL